MGVEFAQPQLSCNVICVCVVADVVAGDVGVIVRIELAGAEDSFVVQAVGAVATDEETSADVLLVTVTAGALIAFGVVAVAVFEEWHVGVDVVVVIGPFDEAQFAIEALGIRGRVCVVTEVIAS